MAPSESVENGALPSRPDDAAARELVLAAAGRLFYARGFTAVGMDELRAESGIPLKRLYRLFPAKEAIVEEVLHHWKDVWTAGITAQVQAAQEPREQLLAVYDFLAGWFTSPGFRGCAFINSFGEVGGAPGRITDIVREQKRHFQDYLARLAAEAGAPDALAPQLAILAEGAITTAAIAASAEPAHHARAAAEILIDVAFHATPVGLKSTDSPLTAFHHVQPPGQCPASSVRQPSNDAPACGDASPCRESQAAPKPR